METWEEAVLWLKNQPDQGELVRAAYFDDPVSAAAVRYYASSEWNALRTLLPKNPTRALDVGAGRGIASYALAMDGWEVTALEPDPSIVVGAGAIRSLKEETGASIQVVSEWGESLPFDGQTFDIVFCRQALHHARDLHAFCRETYRVLKAGGTLYAVREHVLSRHADLQKFFELHPLHHRYGGENAYLLGEYLEAFRSAGFQIERFLNPLQSDINTFPETRADIRRRIAKRLHLPERLIPYWALTRLGAISRAPGRLYSFVARKANNA